MCEFALCSCREQHEEESMDQVYFSVADGKVVESLEK